MSSIIAVHSFRRGTGKSILSANLAVMRSPWLHYEAYDIKFVNNVLHDLPGVGEIGLPAGCAHAHELGQLAGEELFALLQAFLIFGRGRGQIDGHVGTGPDGVELGFLARPGADGRFCSPALPHLLPILV